MVYVAVAPDTTSPVKLYKPLALVTAVVENVPEVAVTVTLGRPGSPVLNAPLPLRSL